MKIHQKNLQILATEIYKVKNDLGPKIMADIFHFVEKQYNLRNNSIMQNLGQQTNVLVGFVKLMLEILASFSGVLNR